MENPRSGQTNFSSLDDQFTPLTFSFFKNFLKALEESDSKDKNGFKVVYIYVLLGAIALLTYVGVDVVKIIFRKNFGRKGFNLFKVILGAIAFGAIAWVNFDFSTSENPTMGDISFSPSVLFITAIFYGIVTLYLLAKGIMEKMRNVKTIHEAYRGDSIYFDFLVNEGWSPAKVQNVAEPLTLLGLGVFLSAVNPFWGVPLIFCALSVWVYLLFEKFYGISHVRDILANQGYKRNSYEDYAEVAN